MTKICLIGGDVSTKQCKLPVFVGIVEDALRTNMPPPAEDDQEANLSRELQTAFGESVRKQRTKLGLKQSDLSVRCGIDQSVISKIERGEQNLTIKQMTRLAIALDGEVTEMLRAHPEAL